SLNPIAKATQAISKANNSADRETYFISLTYIVALFATKLICYEQARALLRSGLHMNVSRPTVRDSTQATSGMCFTNKGSMNLRPRPILVIHTPITDSRRNTILSTFGLNIISRPNYSMLQLACSDLKGLALETKPEAISRLVPRGATVFNI